MNDPFISTIGCAERSEAHQLRTMPLVTRGTSYKQARKSQLEVFDIQYGTTAFEFYGRKMYACGIFMTDENSPWINGKSPIFSHEERSAFKLKAKEVNKAGDGGVPLSSCAG